MRVRVTLGYKQSSGTATVFPEPLLFGIADQYELASSWFILFLASFK